MPSLPCLSAARSSVAASSSPTSAGGIVRATVMSRPAQDRVIVDAGLKVLALVAPAHRLLGSIGFD
jgi:D-serine deaminase-like pyridoxal phosphate-dependent protein